MLCYLQTKESSASQQQSCLEITEPHMRNSSLWSEFVTNADFINVDETEAIQELVSQTSELKAIFNHFKELYVSALNNQYKGWSHLMGQLGHAIPPTVWHV